jgi:elongation factor 1-alpha
MAQTREHVFLARTLGVNQLIIAINKMDATTPPYDEKRYNEVKDEVGKLLRMVGYKIEEIPFIPVSAYAGDNLIKLSDNTKFYKGPFLLDALNGLKQPQKPTNLPLRVPVQDVYTISGVGTVPVGRVETGVMKKDDKIIFQQLGLQARSSQLRCIMKKFQRLFQEITSDGTFVASPRRTFAAEMCADMWTSPPWLPRSSRPR